MKKIIFCLTFAVLGCVNIFAHEAFTLVSSARKTLTTDDLIAAEKRRTRGVADGANLNFTQNEIYLIVKTGPEDDMLSYRIQGLRNPNLIVPPDAELTILFVNSDEDMMHDLRLGHVIADFGIAPNITETVGTNRLEHSSENGVMPAEEIVIKPREDGAYKYFCSVRGHAQDGMWGNIFVGEKPGVNIKMPEKTAHVHSADETENHPHGEMKMNDANKKTDDSVPEMNDDDHKNMPNMAGMDHGAMQMKSVTNLNDPMTRESSGTAWIPDSSPMYARMKMSENGGMMMLMGNMFARYTSVGSKRDVSVAGKGDRQRFDAPAMLMLMYSKPLTEKSQLGLRMMMSLDPIIQRGYGYPLLYQSGEVFHGEPIHDRQHPHDFFSELAATYSYKFNDKNSFYVYAGFPGEPALGPPTFMHRTSASNNPDAPISHHWQDSTHITWGVVTAGYSFGKYKIEASTFKGAEPDENRWNFDKPKLDSYSARFSLNPNKNWAFQISHGYLKNPEPGEPEVKIRRRTTASAIYNKALTNDSNFAGSFVWGQNYDTGGERTNAFLFESNYDFLDKNAVFGRFERVQKSGHELVLDGVSQHGIFNVGAYSIGYLRDLIKDKGLDVGLGGMMTINQNPQSLAPVYSGTTHTGFQIFLRFRPSKMN